MLAKTKQTDLVNESDVMTLLQKSQEWHDNFAAEVLTIIQAYDDELDEEKKQIERIKKLAHTAAWLKVKRMAGCPNGEDLDDEEPESEDDNEEQGFIEETVADGDDDGSDGLPVNKNAVISDHSLNGSDGYDSGTENTSSQTPSNALLASLPSNSHNPSPVTAQSSSLAKVNNPHPSDLMKENRPVVHASKQLKSMK
jgi:hypothetical protein